MTDSVTVAWVHSESDANSWTMSMLNLQAHLLMNGRQGGFIAMRYGSGGIEEARNKVAAAMIGRGVDWLFWIDTDMGFADDTIDRLLEVADPETRPVVGGLCFINKETGPDGMGGFVTEPVPAIFDLAQSVDGQIGFNARRDYKRDALVECSATGSACILIHRSVLETIGGDWYTRIPNETTGNDFGEDISFCVRMMKHGFPCHVHTGVKTSHLKPIWLSEAHYDMWRAHRGEEEGDASSAA